MKLKNEIDFEIQKELKENGLNFSVDEKNKLKIHEFRMDKEAGIGMLYLIPKDNLPEGKLDFLVAPADWVYGVFHFKNTAAIIEVGAKAIDGEIIDYYA